MLNQNLTRQISKCILSSLYRYSVYVVIIALILETAKFFANCWCPNILVDMIAMHYQLEGSHFKCLRTVLLRMTSKVSSPTPICLSLLAIVLIIPLIAM